MSRGNQLQVPRNVDARAVHGPKLVHERQADEEPGFDMEIEDSHETNGTTMEVDVWMCQ